MGERKKSVFHLLAAAVLLFAVSAYRQLSMRYWPEDFLRPYLVWAVYMLLLFGWQYTITTKITQKAMRSHLTAQNIVNILYLTVRFVQDAFLYVNISWMRFTGYFIDIAVIFVPLFGLYGAFYLGKLHAAVDEQCEVAAHGRELAQLGVIHLVLACELHKVRPVYVGIEHVALYVELVQYVVAHDSDFGYFFAGVVGICYCRAQQFAVNVLLHFKG